MILKTLPATSRWNLFKIQGQLDFAAAPAVTAALAHAVNFDHSDLLIDLEDLSGADEVGVSKLGEAVRRLLVENTGLHVAFVVKDKWLTETIKRTAFSKPVDVFASGDEALAAFGLHAAA